MKNNFFVYCLLFTVYCFSSCSSEKKDEKQNLIAQIDSLQKKMVNPKSMALDNQLASKALTDYSDFVKKYPDDTAKSPEYLFRAAELANAMGQHQQAISFLAQVCKQYPQYKKIGDCIFLQGYYYQEFLNDTVRAKQFYQELISKYPTHPFADDAQALMKMFGKSEADIIKGFEKKEKN